MEVSEEVQEILRDQYKIDAGLLFSASLGYGQAPGKGRHGKDKLESFGVGIRAKLSEIELSELYRRANPIANLVDLLPDSSAQRWAQITSTEIDEEIVKEAQKYLDAIKDTIVDGWKKARLYGWSGLVMLADDGGVSYDRPLNVRRVRAWRGLRSVAGGVTGDISVREWQEDPLTLNYGMPSQFYLRGLEDRTVHRSRVVLMYGIKELRSLQYDYELGTSIVERAYTSFRNYDAGVNTIANSLLDWSVDVLEIEDLTRLMAQSKEFANVIAAMYAAKSQLNVMLLEAGKSSYKQIQRSYQGVRDVIEILQVALASSADIPIQMLFNISPSGATSGSWEKDYWAQYVANRQQLELLPVLRELLDPWFLSMGVNPVYTIAFPSILEMDDLQKAEEKYRNAQSQYNLSAALKLLVEALILDPGAAGEVIAGNIDLAQAVTKSLATLKMRQSALMGKPESEKWQGRQLA